MAVEHSQYLGNMNKVLNRQMFKAPTYEHKSTGIASGLEYRPGYKVGGIVKPKRGLVNEPGGYAGEGLEELMARTGMASPLSLEEPMSAAEQLYADMPTVDYGQGTTRGDVVKEGFLRTLDEQRQIRPSRTLGNPNLGASLVSNLITAGKDAETTNKELAMMATAEAKGDAKDRIGTAMDLLKISTEAGMHEAELEQASSLAYADMENRLAIAGLSSDATKYTADVAASKLPSEMQTLNSLLESGVDPQLAFDTAFKQFNSKLQMVGILLESYQMQISTGQTTPEEALQQAITSAEGMFGSGFSVSEDQLEELKEQAEGMDTEGMTGYTTNNPDKID